MEPTPLANLALLISELYGQVAALSQQVSQLSQENEVLRAHNPTPDPNGRPEDDEFSADPAAPSTPDPNDDAQEAAAPTPDPATEPLA